MGVDRPPQVQSGCRRPPPGAGERAADSEPLPAKSRSRSIALRELLLSNSLQTKAMSGFCNAADGEAESICRPSAAVTNARSEHHHPPVAARIRSHVCGPADQPSVKPDTDSFHDSADTLDFVPEHAIKFLQAATFRLNPNYRKLVDDIGF